METLLALTFVSGFSILPYLFSSSLFCGTDDKDLVMAPGTPGSCHCLLSILLHLKVHQLFFPFHPRSIATDLFTVVDFDHNPSISIIFIPPPCFLRLFTSSFTSHGASQLLTEAMASLNLHLTVATCAIPLPVQLTTPWPS